MRLYKQVDAHDDEDGEHEVRLQRERDEIDLQEKIVDRDDGGEYRPRSVSGQTEQRGASGRVPSYSSGS